MDPQDIKIPIVPLTGDSTENGKAQSLPIIDVSGLVAENPDKESLLATAQQINEACRIWGFFYISNHGVSLELQSKLESVGKEFFALPVEKKMAIVIPTSASGRAWRGYFPIGGELTSGKPDLKEGIYLGTEDPSSDENGLPSHGSNLWPAELPELRTIVLEYMDVMKKLGIAIMRGFALSLKLPIDYFDRNYFEDPICLFNLLNYPPDLASTTSSEPRWGVAEHTDYGLLTILKQDQSGGLQIKNPQGGWMEVPPIENTFVCNLGDMLQKVTNGYYLSNPHRVRNIYSGKDRASFPFFLDPGYDADVAPLPLSHLGIKESVLEEFVSEDASKRWDKKSPQTFEGKYGDYLKLKYSTMFPAKSEL